MERRGREQITLKCKAPRKYKKAKEIQNYQTSSSISARIVHLPTSFLGSTGQPKKQDQTQTPRGKLKKSNSHLLSQHSCVTERINYTWAGSNGS